MGRCPAARAVQTNQVLYNLTRRGIEWDLLPWLRERRMPVMAYSPIEQGRLLRIASSGRVRRRHGMTPAQAALAWLLARDDVIAIPKTASRERWTKTWARSTIRWSRRAGGAGPAFPAAARRRFPSR